MERTNSGVDTRPLLGNNNNLPRRANIQEAARYIRRVGTRRIMRQPSVLVRETAAEQLEERQSDWAYSKPVVILDIVWNLAFVIVSVVILISTYDERPTTPLRVWIAGYALQCFLHMLYVGYEYRKRNRGRSQTATGSGNSGNSEVVVQIESRGDGVREQEEVPESRSPEDCSRITPDARNIKGSNRDVQLDLVKVGREIIHDNCFWKLDDVQSIVKRLESVNTMFSFIWWIVGFYWIIAGGQFLSQQAPRLYWLCIIFLAFDVFFVVFCISLACVIGIAVCCCLPCIIAILYAVADQEGASEADVSLLPKYKFCRTGPSEKINEGKSQSYGGIMTLAGGDPTTNRVLGAEDAECCICISAYEDGAELLELPCNHHFHCACIGKWLRMNATCPLCKQNILKGSNNGIRDV